MINELTFYMDETGSRQPDRSPVKSRDNPPSFAFGGILIKREDEDAVKQERDRVALKLGVRVPFHITDMWNERKGFSFLQKMTERERSSFWQTYRHFLSDIPVIGMACVIDRQGYADRNYIDKHPGQPWYLCRSAFDIAVERAVKYALLHGRRMRIIFESDPPFDPIVKSYFKRLKTEGMSFDRSRSDGFDDVTASQFREVLTTIESKKKDHRLLQVADSYIYSIARGKYDKRFPLWRELCDSKRMMNFVLGGDANLIRTMGIRYYCFTKN